jgi:hypothetical protein
VSAGLLRLVDGIGLDEGGDGVTGLQIELRNYGVNVAVCLWGINIAQLRRGVRTLLHGSPSSSGTTHHRTINMISKACEPCGKRKIKCDGQTVCNGCQKDPSACVYRPKARIRAWRSTPNRVIPPGKVNSVGPFCEAIESGYFDSW